MTQNNASLGNMENSLPSRRSADVRLHRFWLQAVAGEILPMEGVARCLKWLCYGKESVQVVQNKRTKKARYHGLQTCKSIWSCPVCAARITAERRRELTEGMGLAVDLKPLLLTYTMQHHLGEPLSRTLDALKEAYKLMKGGRRWMAIEQQYKWVGSIRAMEITHGMLYGWHPHLHELAFIEDDPDTNIYDLAQLIGARWRSSLGKFGRYATAEHGFNLRERNKDIDLYIAKFGHEPSDPVWDLPAEVTQANLKKGRDGGRTPFQILEGAGFGNRRDNGLFKEYFEAVKGSKHLFWSKRLREHLGMGEEKPDEMLIEEEITEAEKVLLAISFSGWQKVVKLGLRGQLLNVAETGDLDALIEFVRVRVGLDIDDHVDL